MKFKFPTLWTIFKRNYNSSSLKYEIPDEYHNSFYLANASLLQIVNYFIHSSYKVVFPELIDKVKTELNCSAEDAAFKIRTCISQLDKCEALIDVHIPLKREYGDVTTIRANRAYHGFTYHDKSLGGLRFDTELTRHNSQGFAAQQTYRNALFGIDMCGAAGGIQICPFVLNEREKHELLSNYMSRVPKFNNLTDLMEPDLGSSALDMDILKSHQNLAPHVEILGKSPSLGGIKDYYKISAKTTLQIIKRFLDNEKISKRVGLTSSLQDKTYILQGLGKAGREIALMMHKEGALCIGVRDHDCFFYEPAGIHVKALFKHMAKFGTIRAFNAKCREYELDSIFAQPCDFMILAAVERCISCKIADKVEAKVLIEVANLPITPTAYKILAIRNKLVIPGLLAGAGPSIMSYYEYRSSTGNTPDNKLEPENVTILFNSALQSAIDDVIKIEENFNLKFNYLEAAYVRAIRNLFKRVVQHQMIQEKSKQKMIGMQ